MENLYGYEPEESELQHIVEPLWSLAYPLSELTLDEDNARHHSQKNWDEVESSIEEHGFRVPIHVKEDDGTVQAGNLRVQILRSHGREWIPAILNDDGEKQSKAFAIVENRASELGDWHYDRLIEQLDDLKSSWGDLSGTGFSGEEHERISEELDSDMNWGEELDELEFKEEDSKMGKVLVHCPPDKIGRIRKVLSAALTQFPDAEVQ